MDEEQLSAIKLASKIIISVYFLRGYTRVNFVVTVNFVVKEVHNIITILVNIFVVLNCCGTEKQGQVL